MEPTFEAGRLSNARLSPTVKFSIPARSSDYLRRQALLDFLYSNTHRKLILIAAAAGYGKTALLTDFAHDADFPVIWCRLDEADRDLTVFVADLFQALHQRWPAFNSSVPKLAVQPEARPENLAQVLCQDIAQQLDEYFVFILDDFHLANVDDAPPLLKFIDTLVLNLPDQAHLCIAGRTIPPLKLASLAARQQIAGLSEEHLRFTAQDVQALLQLRNRLALPLSEAEKMVANTEGWITGILLTTQLMWQGLVAKLVQARQADSPLYDYLANEVFEQQPEALQLFLRESAVLPEMEPVVCNEVLERANSAEYLRQAEARHLFISVVGDEFRTYQYHQLFREFLLAKLRARDPERLQALQLRAAQWYAEHGMAEAAVTFYVSAGDLRRAAQVADANARSLYFSGRQTVLRQWVEQLASVSHHVPEVHFMLARFDTDAGQVDRAEAELEVAVAGFERRRADLPLLEVENQRVLILYRRGAFEQALALATRVAAKAEAAQQTGVMARAVRYAGLSQFFLGHLTLAQASFEQAVQLFKVLRHPYDLAWALSDLANVFRVQGHMAQAAQTQKDALRLWRDQSAPGPLATALNNVALDLHLLGQYDAALSTYAEALDWAKRAANTYIEALILTGQADVWADLGERATAITLYQQAIRKTEQSQDWSLEVYLHRAMARLERWARNFVSALEWLRRAALIANHGRAVSSSPMANLDGLRGIIVVEMGYLDDGRAILNGACTELERIGSMMDLVQALFFKAGAEFRAGEFDGSAQSLARAFKTAEQIGSDQMLVSEALSLQDVLEGFSEHATLGRRSIDLLARAELARSHRARLGVAPGMKPSDVPASLQAGSALEVVALGSSRVVKSGEDVTRPDWTSPRARELFFYLIDRAPIARDRVLADFWSDKTQSKAVNNLHQQLFRIRRAIGDDVILLEEHEFRLKPGLALNYDVHRFETEAKAALALPATDLRRHEALASAIALYTGDYLADMPVDWALERRRSLSELHVTLLRVYVDELMNLMRYQDARNLLLQALTIEPFRDDLHHRMLLCLSALGWRHEIVSHYVKYREMMRAELGLDPPLELRNLYSQLIG
jgi:ATP/maltotriose-dependent transcriptional regulator MalT/DNA-binding SARP family transcriptional activator